MSTLNDTSKYLISDTVKLIEAFDEIKVTVLQHSGGHDMSQQHYYMMMGGMIGAHLRDKNIRGPEFIDQLLEYVIKLKAADQLDNGG